MNLDVMLKKWETCAYCSTFSLKCVESLKNSEEVNFLMLIIRCLFPYRVGTYRQVLHLFLITITLFRKLKSKYMATNNMGTFYTITIG